MVIDVLLMFIGKTIFFSIQWYIMLLGPFICVAIDIGLELYKAYNEFYIYIITIKIKIIAVLYQCSIITLNDGDTKMLVGHECMLPGIRTTIF